MKVKIIMAQEAGCHVFSKKNLEKLEDLIGGGGADGLHRSHGELHKIDEQRRSMAIFKRNGSFDIIHQTVPPHLPKGPDRPPKR